METSMNSKLDGDDIARTEILNMAPPPTATQESEQATEINDVQLPPLSNDPGQQFTGKALRAEIPDSEDFSESSGDDVYVPACGLPMQECIQQGGREDRTGSNGTESLNATTKFESKAIASSNPVEGDMQVEDTTPLPNINIRAPTEWNPVKFMGTRMPVSTIGAPITGPADAPRASHEASTTEGASYIPSSSPIVSSQPDGEKTADEVASGNDGNPEEDKDAEMAEVPASGPELETTSTSSEEKPRSDIPGHEDSIEDTTHSSTVLQHLDAFERPSVNLTKTPVMSEPAIEVPPYPPLASPKGKPANSVEIQASSPRSIQDSADSSRVSSPEKSAARKTVPCTIEGAPEVEKVRADIPSSPPKPDRSQSKSSKRSTPTASFSAPEGSQSKDILVAELKAMKIASIQARNTALEAEIAAKRAKLSDVTKDLKKPAEETVKRHIKLLHDYNDIRDVGQGLVGMIADNRGVRIGELYEEFGVGLKD